MVKVTRQDGPRTLRVNHCHGLQSGNAYTTFIGKPFEVNDESDLAFFRKEAIYHVEETLPVKILKAIEPTSEAKKGKQKRRSK